jgi:hypothetical protein
MIMMNMMVSNNANNAGANNGMNMMVMMANMMGMGSPSNVPAKDASAEQGDADDDKDQFKM